MNHSEQRTEDVEETIALGLGDALIVVDVQVDFLPGGALAVPESDRIVPVLNRYIELFHAQGLPLVFTRDWHPADHCSFATQGGVWPVHCVAGTHGADFASNLVIPAQAMVMSKATLAEAEAYSGFQGTTLEAWLRSHGSRRLFIGGLATEYCVLETVQDALRDGFAVLLLEDAMCAVTAEGGRLARQAMIDAGACPIGFEALSREEP